MKLASIEKIHSFSVHPNAEKLEKAKVLMWDVCVPKGQYKEGELVIFIFPDVIVDENNPHFDFMRSRKFRVWQAAFRGEPSAGLVCPIHVLNFYVNPNEATFLPRDVMLFEEGAEVSEIIKCKKYERPADPTIRCDARGNFPTELISITDEDNLLSNPKVISEFVDKECVISLKYDGSSVTFILNNEDYMVCSRRLSLKDDPNNVFWNMSRKYDIENKLKNYGKNIAVQGEVVGPKMNGNVPQFAEHCIFIFNVKLLDENRYLDYNELVNFCKELDLPMVPIVSEFVWNEVVTLDSLKEIANNVKYGNDIPAEGIVIRPRKMTYSSYLKKMLSVKIINQDYK